MAAFTAVQAGLSVLVLDKAQFPRVKPCAGGLTIKSLNLLPFSISEIVQSATGTLLMGYKHNHPITYSTNGFVCAFVVRETFDKFLHDKMCAAGAEFCQITSLDAIEATKDGVSIRINGGKLVSCKYVVAADGANSQCRRLLEPKMDFARGFALEGLVPYDMIDHIPQMEFDFGCVDYGYGWLFPKKDHVNVGIYTCNDAVKLSKDGLRRYVHQKLGTKYIDHVVGFPLGFGGHTYVQKNNRVLFAGDAAGMAEPLLGEGIHNALKSGISAGRCVADAVTSNRQIATTYNAALSNIRSDIQRCHTLAHKFFYPKLDTSARNAMKVPLVQAVLMRGFASGLTLSATMNSFPIVPFKRPSMPSSIASMREKQDIMKQNGSEKSGLVVAD